MEPMREGSFRRSWRRASIASAACILLSVAPTWAGDVTVPTDFATIQAAIDDPGTTAGDTINVLAGTYAETAIHVTKSVTIAGAGIGSTFLEPSGIGFYVDADGVTLRDMTVQNGTQAIRFEMAGGTIDSTTVLRLEAKNNTQEGIEIHALTTVTNLVVDSCNFENTNIGARVSSSGHLEGAEFRDSTFTGNLIGIYEANDDSTSTMRNLLVTGCTFTSHTFAAIYMEEVRDALIEGNMFVDNDRDIEILKWYQPAVPVSHVAITNNTMTGTTNAVFAIFNAEHASGQTAFSNVSFTLNTASTSDASAVYASAHSSGSPSLGGLGWNTVVVACNTFAGITTAGTGVRFFNPGVAAGQELGGSSINVKSNWWGTTDMAAITALMEIPAITAFVPFLTAPQMPECVQIFTDGFESGDTLAWSSTVP